MAGDRIHGDGEGQQVARHDENEEQDPASADELAAPCPADDFARIGHRCDLRVSALHLTHDESRVRGDQAEANQDDNGTKPQVSYCDMPS